MRRFLPPLILFAILLAGCTTQAEGSWVLTGYLRDGESIPLVEQVTLDVSGSEIQGFSGCNGYFGAVSDENDELTFSEVASTEAWCEDTEVMALEAMFLNDLVSYTWSATVTGSTMTLLPVPSIGPSIAVATELTFEENP